MYIWLSSGLEQSQHDLPRLDELAFLDHLSSPSMNACHHLPSKIELNLSLSFFSRYGRLELDRRRCSREATPTTSVHVCSQRFPQPRQAVLSFRYWFNHWLTVLFSLLTFCYASPHHVPLSAAFCCVPFLFQHGKKGPVQKSRSSRSI